MNRDRTLTGAAISIGILPLAFAASGYLHKDLWWDEILSLMQTYILGPGSTLADFKQANNHVFFNLVEGLWSRLFGIVTLNDAIGRVIALRALPLGFSILTVAYSCLLARRFVGKAAANLTAVILCTTIPFLNFAMQLRGYSLSMLLVSALLFHTWSFLTRPTKFHAGAAVVSCFLLLYTLTSTAYFVVALCMVLAAESIFRIATGHHDIPGRRFLSAMALPAAGGAIALLAYAPMLGQILSCKYIMNAPPVRLYALQTLLPRISLAFMSGRFLLPLLAASGGAIAFVRMVRNKAVSDEVFVFIRLALLYFLPFAISLARNDMPPDRSFVMLAPVVALMLASGISLLFASSERLLRRAGIAAACIAAYCLISFAGEWRAIRHTLDGDIITGGHHQDLLYNTCLSAAWHPRVDLQLLAREYRENPAPVLVVDDVDRLAAYSCLDELNITDYFAMQVAQNASGGPEYILSRAGGACGSFDVVLPSGLPENAPKLFIRLLIVLQSTGFIPAGSQFYAVAQSPQRLESLLNTLGGGFDPVMLNATPTCTNIFRLTMPEKLNNTIAK